MKFKIFFCLLLAVFLIKCKSREFSRPIFSGKISVIESPFNFFDYLNGLRYLLKYNGKKSETDSMFVAKLLEYRNVDSAIVYFNHKFELINRNNYLYQTVNEKYIQSFSDLLSKRDTAYYNIGFNTVLRIPQFDDDTSGIYLPMWSDAVYPAVGFNYELVDAYCKRMRDWRLYYSLLNLERRCNWKKIYLKNYNLYRNNFWRLPKAEELEEAYKIYGNDFPVKIQPEFPTQYFIQNEAVLFFAVMYYNYRGGKGISLSKDNKYKLPKIKPPVFFTYENFLSEFTNEKGVFWGNNSLDTSEEQRANKIKHLSDTLVPFLATFRCVCEKKDSLPELQYKKGKLTTVPKDAHRR